MFKTAPCIFPGTTPALRFQVKRTGEGFLCIEAEVELNGPFFPLSDFTQAAFLLGRQNEYFILRYTDYKTLCCLRELDWQETGSDVSRFTETVISRLEPDYPVNRNALLEGIAVNVAPVGMG